jgi:hypothetical protein
MSDLPENLSPYAERLSGWIATYHYDHFAQTARDLPLRRDVLTLLNYVQDNKVMGTKSTGNMPLKHIRALTAQFVNPPILDQMHGNREFKLRSEFDVWPLFLLHVILEAAELIVTPQGGRWYLTNAGIRFLMGDPLLQVLSLFSAWWHRIDWRIALTVQAGELPEGFPTSTLAYLLAQPIGKWIEVGEFATTLNARTGLGKALSNIPGLGDWHQDSQALVWDVNRMITDQLALFQIIEGDYLPDVATFAHRRLKAFKITWFGKAMLEGLNL